MSDARNIGAKPPEPDRNPSPEEIRKILKESKTVAIIGLSNKAGRPSHDVGVYLKEQGYTVIPVNPKLTEWEGVKSYSSLSKVPGPVDIVDIFRRAGAIDGLVGEIAAKKPRCAWLQLGIVNNEAAERIRQAGIEVVQDRCMKIERASLFAH